jgi:hypothetical protein
MHETPSGVEDIFLDTRELSVKIRNQILVGVAVGYLAE